jgi:hypothetical protein
VVGAGLTGVGPPGTAGFGAPGFAVGDAVGLVDGPGDGLADGVAPEPVPGVAPGFGGVMPVGFADGCDVPGAVGVGWPVPSPLPPLSFGALGSTAGRSFPRDAELIGSLTAGTGRGLLMTLLSPDPPPTVGVAPGAAGVAPEPAVGLGLLVGGVALGRGLGAGVGVGALGLGLPPATLGFGPDGVAGGAMKAK